MPLCSRCRHLQVNHPFPLTWNGINYPLQRRRGFWHMLVQTAQKEGLRGLMRGLVPRLYVQVPSSAVTLAGYEFVKAMAKKQPQTTA